MDKSKILFVRAKLKKDYVFDGIKKMGYDIVIPYYDHNLFFRCIREVWFRLHLPGKSIWFNRKIRNCGYDYIIVKDPLIVPEFMEWVRSNNPKARIILSYDNRVSERLDPGVIDSSIEKWSYCEDDCNDYNLRLKPPAYLDCYRFSAQNCKIEYDIIYLGKDKGRLDQLMKLEHDFNKRGFSTLFHICADRSFLKWKNKRYKPFIPYEEYLELLKRSRASLNIMPPEQKGITQREMEAVFDNKKCITTNKSIKQFALYDAKRFFVLGEDSIDSIGDFMNDSTEPVAESELILYTFDKSIEAIITEE